MILIELLKMIEVIHYSCQCRAYVLALRHGNSFGVFFPIHLRKGICKRNTFTAIHRAMLTSLYVRKTLEMDIIKKK
jgi:hypothetical protein